MTGGPRRMRRVPGRDQDCRVTVSSPVARVFSTQKVSPFQVVPTIVVTAGIAAALSKRKKALTVSPSVTGCSLRTSALARYGSNFISTVRLASPACTVSHADAD